MIRLVITLHFNRYWTCIPQFLQQYRHYQSNVQIFKLQPDKPNKELADLAMFLAQVSSVPLQHHWINYINIPVVLSSLYCTDKESVSWFLQVGHCYVEHLSAFPQELTGLLLGHHTVLDSDLRMVRNRNQATT